MTSSTTANISNSSIMRINTELNNADGKETTTATSQAAACIRLNFLGKTFHPVFTHQLFEDERIRGYESFPKQGALDSEQDTRNTTSSGSASSYLSIDITLAPSCRSCSIDFQVEEKPKDFSATEEETPTKNSKNRRNKSIGSTNDDSDYEDNDDSSYHAEDDCSISLGSSSDRSSTTDEDSTHAATTAVSTRQQMTLKEISDALKRALPPCSLITGLPLAEQDKEKDNIATRRRPIRNQTTKPTPSMIENDYLTKVPGKIMHEYTRKNDEYVLSLASVTPYDKTASTYHDQIQNLALWFIETADNVDIASTDDGGHWNVLYLFQKHTTIISDTNHSKKRKRKDEINITTRYSLAGYMTLFHIHSPCKKPNPGTIIRVCQVLILPPYQRCGHGKDMLTAAYRLAQEKQNVVEVNVESPAPACMALRDLVDWKLLESCCSFSENDGHMNEGNGFFSSMRHRLEVSSNFIQPLSSFETQDMFQPLPEKEVIRVSSLLKITPNQLQHAFELHKLSQLFSSSFEEKTAKTKKELFKRYRLMVKKRLLKLHKEELSLCPNKDEMKRQLDEMFRPLVMHYAKVCKVTIQDSFLWSM